MPAPDFLRSLLTTPGPSGREAAPARVWRAEAEGFATVTTDVMGSSVARVDGTGDGPLLALVGHIDEIGLTISHIDDDGFLSFVPIGGWDPQILIAQRVEILAAAGSLPGVIGRRPIHLLKDEDRKKVPDIRELHIDIGARDADDARSMVRAGDVAVIAGEPLELPNGRLASRSMDNRLGCYVVLEAARRVAQAGGAPGPVAAVAASQEEIGLNGAGTTAFSLEPQVAIAVDVTHATDAPGVDLKQVGGKHGFGSGPVISTGPTIHPVVFELLRETAESEGIPFATEVAGRGTGTDADAIFASRGGVPTGVVSLALRYMHSPVEMVDLADVEATARLLAAFAQRLDASVSFER